MSIVECWPFISSISEAEIALIFVCLSSSWLPLYLHLRIAVGVPLAQEYQNHDNWIS